MTSPTINVVRYSALLGGMFYGIAHRRSLQAQENKKREHAAEHRQEHLVQQAKKAWQDKQAAKSFAGGVITDPEDPKFDLEKLLESFEKQK